MRDGGLDVQIVNFAIPGMTWLGARVATPGLLYGDKDSPFQAVKRGTWDYVLICLGVNDRKNPNADRDAAMLKEALTDVHCPKIFVRQHFYDDRAPDATLVTQEESARMQDIYDGLGATVGVSFWAAYDCGLTYDKLHPTDKGVVWLAASLYRHFEALWGLTPIGWSLVRLWTLKQADKAAFAQALKVSD